MIACKSSKRYVGKRKPRCNAGVGCELCWRKYWIFNYSRECQRAMKLWKALAVSQQRTQKAAK